jgi:hypothetical protein
LFDRVIHVAGDSASDDHAPGASGGAGFAWRVPWSCIMVSPDMSSSRPGIARRAGFLIVSRGARALMVSRGARALMVSRGARALGVSRGACALGVSRGARGVRA